MNCSPRSTLSSPWTRSTRKDAASSRRWSSRRWPSRAERFPKVVFWADSRRRIRRFRRVIIKPNQFEAVGIVDQTPDKKVELDRLCAAVAALRREIGGPICATRGAEGMLVSDPQPTLVPGVRVDGPTDPTGAGDSATAGAVLALAAGAALPEAALIGNLVASITVQQLSTTGTARPEQLPPRLDVWLARIIHKYSSSAS